MKGYCTPTPKPDYVPHTLTIVLETQDEYDALIQLGNYGSQVRAFVAERIKLAAAHTHPATAFKEDVAESLYPKFYHILKGKRYD